MKQQLHLSILTLCCLVLAACNSESSVPDANPAIPYRVEMWGRSYEPAAVIAENEQFYWAQQILSEYRNVKSDDIPASVEVLAHANCNFPTPAEGEKLLHAHFSIGMQNSPLYWLSEKDLESRVQRIIEGYNIQHSPGVLRSWAAEKDEMSMVNVLITDTSQPLYLVLSSSRGIIWNIQAHPDAKIARIAIISEAPSGIANLPEGTPVTALWGRSAQNCKALPELMPRKDWPIVANKDDYDAGLHEVLAKYRSRASTYSTWFRKNFGRGSDDRAIATIGAGNVLFGPLPANKDARFPYTPLAGATLYMAREGHFFPGGEKAYKEQVLTLVLAKISASGGAAIASYIRGE